VANKKQTYEIKSRNPPVSLRSQPVINSLMPVFISDNLENLEKSCIKRVEILHWNPWRAIVVKCEVLVASKDLHSKEGINEVEQKQQH